jgi:hypothetical protein
MPSEPGPGPAHDATRARAALGTLLTTGLVCAAGAVLAQRAMLAEGAQALLANAGASFLGADGADKPGSEGTARAVAVWSARGAGIAAGFALFAIGLARATGAVGPISVSTFVPGILLGLLDATLGAMRDEFLLHGLVLRVARGAPRAVGLVACGLASAAWSIGASGASGVPVTRALVEALLGVSLGAMWQRERGGAMAVTAHTLWLLATTGGLVLLRPRAGFWGGGDAGFLASGCALAAAALACSAASLWARRASRGETSTSPAPLG